MSLKEVAGELEKYRGKRVLLLTHHNADVDAIGSAIALSFGLKKLNCSVQIGVVESISKLAKKIADDLGCKVEINPKLDQDLIVLLDTSTPGQLSEFIAELEKAGASKILIDHHAIQDTSINAELSFVDEGAHSTARIVHTLLNEMGIKPDKNTATAIMLGIITDTAHLRFAGKEDLKLIVNLLEQNSLEFRSLLEMLSLPPDVSENIAKLKAAKRLKLYRIKDYLIVTSKVRSFEASAAKSFIKIGADLAVVAAEREKELRISLRSSSRFARETNINLGKDIIPEVARIIDGSGSGHLTAAGANGKSKKNLEKALNYVIDKVKQAEK